MRRLENEKTSRRGAEARGFHPKNFLYIRYTILKSKLESINII
jgi:hypothetical protein